MCFGLAEGLGDCAQETGQNGKKSTSRLVEICPHPRR